MYFIQAFQYYRCECSCRHSAPNFSLKFGTRKQIKQKLRSNLFRWDYAKNTLFRSHWKPIYSYISYRCAICEDHVTFRNQPGRTMVHALFGNV